VIGRRRALAGFLAVCIVLAAAEAAAYLKLGTNVGTRVVTLRWPSFPVRYFVTNRDVPGVTAQQAQQAIDHAFSTWASVPNVTLSSQFAGFTGAVPGTGDGINVLGFQNRPDLERVLGSTSFTVDTVTGEIVESDIFFNSTFAWSVASGGEAGRQDFESIALHEIGHLLGLGHSMLGETELIGGGRRVLSAEAVMFPIAFTAGSVNRTLRADDIAGISDIYGTDTFRRSTGSVTGRVTKSGTGVVGAHVVAFSPASGTLVGGFTLSNDGTFVIAGLAPGPHVIRVEPLDDGDINSFFDSTQDVDINFRPAFSDKLVTVPRGGTSRSIELKVVAK
jgi:matrixin